MCVFRLMLRCVQNPCMYIYHSQAMQYADFNSFPTWGELTPIKSYPYLASFNEKIPLEVCFRKILFFYFCRERVTIMHAHAQPKN